MNAIRFAPLLLALGACSTTPLPPKAGDASIAGEIRAGSGAVPALRVCAVAVSVGSGRCIDVPPMASSYRIDRLGAGRYYVMAWAREGDVRLYAHAETIRCVKEPCPPDNLVPVDIADGQARDGVDLNGSYAQVPAGWPGEPAP